MAKSAWSNSGLYYYPRPTSKRKISQKTQATLKTFSKLYRIIRAFVLILVVSLTVGNLILIARAPAETTPAFFLGIFLSLAIFISPGIAGLIFETALLEAMEKRRRNIRRIALINSVLGVIVSFWAQTMIIRLFMSLEAGRLFQKCDVIPGSCSLPTWGMILANIVLAGGLALSVISFIFLYASREIRDNFVN